MDLTGPLLRRHIYRPLNSECRSLVDEGQYPAPRDLAGGDDRLALSKRGVIRDGDDEISDGLAISRVLRHLLGKREDAGQHLLALRYHVSELECWHAALFIIAEVVLVEELAESELLPPSTARLHVGLGSEVLTQGIVEEERHFRRGLANMCQGVVSEDSACLKVGHRRGRLPLRVEVQHDLQGNALAHQRDLEEFMPQVHAHDLGLA
mmetsp:Transcript_98760/g.235403  ORF Transcript_98760/g.235403 Transcript_98760/m.235403 type:complete len:208 (-) Transcript_98760:144-767(-)